MSTFFSNVGRSLLSKLGVIAVLAGSAVIVGESLASVTFSQATGRIESLVQRCELVESNGSNRSSKIISEGTCDEIAALQLQMASLPLQVKPYPAAMLTFRDDKGAEITARAHVAGLGVTDPHPGDLVPILYRSSDTTVVRGPTNLKNQSLAGCAVLVGVMMLFARRKI